MELLDQASNAGARPFKPLDKQQNRFSPRPHGQAAKSEGIRNGFKSPRSHYDATAKHPEIPQ
jgi:hypothetical protein